MLTDTTLRHLKPKPKRYKFADRDGMYALVSPSRAISFRYDYRLNGCPETAFIVSIFGRHGGIYCAVVRIHQTRKLVLLLPDCMHPLPNGMHLCHSSSIPSSSAR